MLSLQWWPLSHWSNIFSVGALNVTLLHRQWHRARIDSTIHFSEAFYITAAFLTIHTFWATIILTTFNYIRWQLLLYCEFVCTFVCKLYWYVQAAAISCSCLGQRSAKRSAAAISCSCLLQRSAAAICCSRLLQSFSMAICCSHFLWLSAAVLGAIILIWSLGMLIRMHNYNADDVATYLVSAEAAATKSAYYINHVGCVIGIDELTRYIVSYWWAAVLSVRLVNLSLSLSTAHRTSASHHSKCFIALVQCCWLHCRLLVTARKQTSSQ